MKQFNEKDIDVLICTDVAARGLDIKGVSHVYNYDSPNESNQYLHRIGRTARAGEAGKAVNIVASRDYDNFRKIMREHVGKIEKQELPVFEDVRIEFKHKPSSRFGGRREGNRGGSSRFGGGSRFGGRDGGRREGRFGSREGGSRFGGRGGRDGGRRSSSRGRFGSGRRF